MAIDLDLYNFLIGGDTELRSMDDIIAIEFDIKRECLFVLAKNTTSHIYQASPLFFLLCT